MTVLLQISDPHFGTERPSVLEALIRLVRQKSPDLLVLSGDITQRATRAQFSAARRFVDRLAVPRFVAIPGNHDISLFNPFARLFWPYANYLRCFGPELETEIDLPDLLLLALNTTRPWRHIDGELSLQQIEQVAQRLNKASPRQLRIVVTHQPVAVSRVQDKHNLLHRHNQAINRWADAGADLILGGHIHLPFVQALHESHSGLTRPMWAVQAGTALSTRIRHKTENSVNLIKTITVDGAVPASERHNGQVERWDFQPDIGEFAAVGRQMLQLGDVLACVDVSD